jgi:sulfur-oxidizing protein SoxY
VGAAGIEGGMMRSILSMLAAALLGLGLLQPALAGEGNWPSIRDALFADRELKDGAAVIALQAPERAHDAAVVPVTISSRLPADSPLHIRAVHLVIDQNPAPVAAVFRFADGSPSTSVSTRVRINEYTSVHAVVELSDGDLYVAERFVKAAGGCSAPALKDKEAAMARLGQMKLKPQPTFIPGEPNRVQLLVSHPNYSGLQIDQLSRAWIPPDYVRSVKISYAGQPVLDIEGDISISEDPSFTFTFVPREPGEMKVVVEDNKDRRFEQRFPLGLGT